MYLNRSEKGWKNGLQICYNLATWFGSQSDFKRNLAAGNRMVYAYDA